MKSFKQILEAIKDKADEGEYDYEGDMAKSQLRSIITNSKRIHDMLDDTTNLPEWVQSKITLAEDYISTASNYLQSEMTEDVVKKNLKEKWSKKYKSSIDCSNPKGFSQKAHCASKKKNESVAEEAPTNSVGGGNIAGVGVGAKGEPGVPLSATEKRKKKNKEDENTQTILVKMMRRKFNG